MARRASVTVMSVGVGLCCALLCGCATVSYRVASDRALAMEVATGKLIGNRWITITGRGISFEDAWFRVVGTIGEVYEIEVLDKASGYLRTVTKEREIRFKYGDDFSGWKWTAADFRSAIIVRCMSKDPPSFRIKIDNERYRDGWKPMDEIFREDERILSEIRALLGVLEE
ncbi:hypothetical protein LR066_02510 [candidate division WOR-3 bacterium]|nr:hypothetical protein [candidate division WOR-3 bacterium]